MEKDEILKLSREENQNKDLAEQDASAYAGSIAARVGASACCLTSLLFRLAAGQFPFSPWAIYFSILSAHSFAKYGRLKKKTDLLLGCAYCAMCVLAFAALALRLMERKA